MPNPTDKACAICTKRHETGNPGAPIQCRALPPVQGLGRDAIFPTVAADAYCHAHFQTDAGAVAARTREAAESARLDDAVAATAAAQAALPLDPAPAAEEPAPVPAEQPKRARRARAADGE